MSGNENKSVRCAIYTRKSSDEGLEKEFTSLDAQRERCEDYIASQKGEGWKCLPDRYDDGGYSGGSMERPALRRLLADVAAGKIDIVLTYKVDRLSRSLADFTRLIDTFESRKVAFVSVTQRFDTSQAMGRLTLNMLLSFAQFERELASERTRDKIAASRRRGQWWGARPPLGYGIDRDTSTLVVMPEEAALVRHIFETYVRTRSLIRTATELNAAGHRTKRWRYRDGREVGGRKWDKPHVRLVIANVTVRGMVSHKGEFHPGRHEAIVADDLWRTANDILASNARNGSDASQPLRHGLLNGLLRCAACEAAMTHTCAVRRSRTYRYYVCGSASRNGRSSCPYPSVPAEQVESFVLAKVRDSLADRDIIDAAAAALEGADVPAHRHDVTRLLRDFDPVWSRLNAGERKRLLGLVISRIDCDAANDRLSITFADLTEREVAQS